MQIDTDYRPGIDVDLTLEGGDIDMLLKGKEVEYLERTWNEPRYGETPIQHFNRIHGVSE